MMGEKAIWLDITGNDKLRVKCTQLFAPFLSGTDVCTQAKPLTLRTQSANNILAHGLYTRSAMWHR